MGLVILAVVLVAICVICAVKGNKSVWSSEGWFIGSLVSGAFAAISILLMLIGGIDTICTDELVYEKMVEKKTAIEYRLEHLDDENSYMTNGGVYEDLVEYNNELRDLKYWANSFWVGWFNPDKAADELDYIKLPGRP